MFQMEGISWTIESFYSRAQCIMKGHIRAVYPGSLYSLIWEESCAQTFGFSLMKKPTSHRNAF